MRVSVEKGDPAYDTEASLNGVTNDRKESTKRRMEKLPKL